MKSLYISILLFFPLVIYPQKNMINATFIYDIDEKIVIRDNSFIIYYNPTFAWLNYGIDKGDSILTEGKVEYESCNFIKLTSKDYEWEAKNNMIIKESVDSDINDSIKFNFFFPFDGKFKTTIRLNDNYSKQQKFENIKFFFHSGTKRQYYRIIIGDIKSNANSIFIL
jgi:hypothetical protein